MINVSNLFGFLTKRVLPSYCLKLLVFVALSGTSLSCSIIDNSIRGTNSGGLVLKIEQKNMNGDWLPSKVSNSIFLDQNLTIYSLLRDKSGNFIEPVTDGQWSLSDDHLEITSQSLDSINIKGAQLGVGAILLTHPTWGQVELSFNTLALPEIDVTLSRLNIENENLIQGNVIEWTFETIDQYGQPIFTPNTTIELSFSGGNSTILDLSVTDLENGQYHISIFADRIGTPLQPSVMINSQPVTSPIPQVSVNTSRMSFTGNSLSTSPVANRMFDEAPSGEFVVTGLCDVNLGDVHWESPQVIAQTQDDLIVPCSTTNGGEFSFNIYYDSTSPYGRYLQGAIQIYVWQASQQPIHTWIYKVPSTVTPILITNNTEFQNMALALLDPAVMFILTSDLVFTGSNNWTPVGDIGTEFMGQFSGDGHTVTGLDFTRNSSRSGLFGVAQNADISNIYLQAVNFTENNGFGRLGALVGHASSCKIDHIVVQGNVVGQYKTGGLVGSGDGSYDWWMYLKFSGSINGGDEVGGILGSGNASIFYSAVAGLISGGSSVGGIVGYGAINGNIRFSSVKADLTASSSSLGGIAGEYTTSIFNTYFSGALTGGTDVAGLVAEDFFTPFIYNSYSAVTAISSTGTNDLSYISIKPVPFSNNSYYLSEAVCPNCVTPPAKIVPLNSVQIKKRAQFEGFDFVKTWTIDEGTSMPELRWEELF